MNVKSSRAAARLAKAEAVGELRRGAILGAARKVLSRKGLRAATLEEVAALAGLAKGTIYLYFASKEELCHAVLRHDIAELHERTRLAVTATRGARARVRAFIATRLGYFEEHRELFRIYHAELGNMLEAHQQLAAEFKESILAQVALLEHAVASGVRQGEMRRVPARRVAFVLFDVTRGLMLSRLLDKSPPPLDREVDLLVDLAWNGLRP